MPVRTTELLEDYRLHLAVECQLEPASAAKHRRTVVAFLRETGSPLEEVGTADLERYTRRPGLADGTRAQYTSQLKGFTAWAAAGGHLAADPFAAVRLPRVPPLPARDVSLGDLARLLAYLTPRPRLWAMAWLAYGAGLRSMEVAGARRERVSLGGAQPSVEVFGKGRRWRTVPLAPVVAEVLGLWLAPEWMRGPGPLVGSEPDPAAHVSAAWVSRCLSGALHDCGVAETAHGLRHAFAKQILARCGDLRAVQELLGHASIKSTERYVQGVSAETERAVALLPDPRSAGRG